MLDKVLEVVPTQEKAIFRKATCLIETADYTNAEKTIRQLEDIAFQDQDKQNELYPKIKQLRQKMNQNSKEEEEFSKKIFQNAKNGIYNEKPNAKTKEQEAEEERLAKIEEANRKKWEAVAEEAEYLGTVSATQWLIYPFFKTIETLIEKTCGCCKNERGRIPHPNAKTKPKME